MQYECRWCGKLIMFLDGHWHHQTATERHLCPHPLPFADQLPRWREKVA